jgi:CheY-like chemotaxis protein
MIAPETNQAIKQILIVEDSYDDVVLMKMALKQSGPSVTLHHVAEGLDCMTFLRKGGPWTDAPTPDLILLDLNMPRMNGVDVLKTIMEDCELCHLPVIVFSTSQNPDEVEEVYRLGCRSFIVKPINFDRLMQIVRTLVEYWFTVVALPTRLENRNRSHHS